MANTVSIGSAGNERRLTNVAAGTNATDAVNVGQLKSTISGFQSQIGGLQMQIIDNQREVRRGIFAAVALAPVLMRHASNKRDRARSGPEAAPSFQDLRFGRSMRRSTNSGGPSVSR